MKPKLVLFAAVMSLILNSCGVDTKSLGGNFVLYRDQGSMQFTAIGLNLAVGVTQGLIDGRFLKYGYDDHYVVAMVENDHYFYFDKISVYNFFEKPEQGGKHNDKKPIIGPIGISEFTKATKELGLPPLSYEVK